MKTLIKNIDIITMDADKNRYPGGAILYEGDTIEYVGPFRIWKIRLRKTIGR